MLKLVHYIKSAGSKSIDLQTNCLDIKRGWDLGVMVWKWKKWRITMVKKITWDKTLNEDVGLDRIGSCRISNKKSNSHWVAQSLHFSPQLQVIGSGEIMHKRIWRSGGSRRTNVFIAKVFFESECIVSVGSATFELFKKYPKITFSYPPPPQNHHTPASSVDFQYLCCLPRLYHLPKYKNVRLHDLLPVIMLGW